MTMDVFFQSGHVAFVMLAVMVLELWLLRRYLRHMPIIAAGLGAGACLVLALRSALLDQGWPVISIFLIMSFGFHLLEIQQCLRLARRLQY